MKTIYFVRHGAIAHRYDKRFIGRTDVPLSDEGRRQARRLAALFRGRTEMTVLSSPLRRARATARLAAPKTKVSWRLLPDLREMDFGRWEGMTFEEIRRRDAARVGRWAAFSPGFRFPGGEGLRSFRTRLKRVQNRMFHEAARELLVVSHGGIIRSLLCLWSGKDLSRYPEIQVRPGSVSVVRVRAGRPRVVSIGVPLEEVRL
ncbi:MAG: histidine phosphatase family protein [Elusimicrobia bacterium]|nr:histidine phosphatase family protein [Elusimicrobiota bacterium]